MIARIALWLFLLTAVVVGAAAAWHYLAPAEPPPAEPPVAPPPAGENANVAAPDVPPPAPAPDPGSEPDPFSPAPPIADTDAVPGSPPPPVGSLGPGLHALVFTCPTAEQPVDYLLFFPKSYPAGGRWPLLFYLHGKSLSGDDPQVLTRYGPPRIASRDPSFPFVVVAPQCRAGERWTDVATLDALLADVLAHYAVDPDRVYLTGYSMGAGGVWRFGGTKPERFAAAAAIAGVEETVWAKKLARVPVWVFHGTDDEDVPASGSEAMVAAIQAAGGDARLELLPGRGHDVVDVYDRKDLYDWFLAHRRRR